MVLSKQTRDKTIKTWPREPRKVADFTDSGKKCILRLQKQVETRLPAPKAHQCLYVLLDPVTNKFARSLLTEEGCDGLYFETRALLKEKHCEAYKVLNAPKPSPSLQAGEKHDTEADDELAEPMEMETSPPEYIDTLLGLTCDLAPPLEETVESNSDT